MKYKYKTLRVSDEEYMLISEVQRLVSKKGYDFLRARLTPNARLLLDSDKKLTKRRVIALGCQVLLDCLAREGEIR